MRRNGRTINVLTYAIVRLVHEQPYNPKTMRGAVPKHGFSAEELDERQQAAQDSLLQFHMMIHNGIQPDALMYTALIRTMGRAQLEWQAYKLFSRMLEQNISPLPETYVALKLATSPTRQKLIADIEAKISAAVETLPGKLADVQKQIQEEEKAFANLKFASYFSGDLDPPTGQPSASSPSSRESELTAAASPLFSTSTLDEQQATPGPRVNEEGEAPRTTTTPRGTVVVKHPHDVWSSHKVLEEMQNERMKWGGTEDTASLRLQLACLHEEELRIFLSVHRQLRHGAKDDLVARVLASIPPAEVAKMLQRRNKYFRSVETLLEDQKRARDESVAVEQEPDEDVAAAPKSELAQHEEQELAGDVLYTPWGAVRKPPRNPVVPEKKSLSLISRKLLRKRLSDDELADVHRRAQLDEIDDVPSSVLRRYAFQFHLKWRRKVPSSLFAAVSWHSKTYSPKNGGGLVTPEPTLSARRQVSEKDVALKTLDNFEAFRIMSQRTQNLQVVDSAESNLHAQHLARITRTKERKADELLRRQRNLAEAAVIKESAQHYTSMERRDAEVSRILGLDAGVADAPPELPPWALRDSMEPFNIRTGRFGDEKIGRYQELSDGKVKLRPVYGSEQEYHVEHELLPEKDRLALRKLKLAEESGKNEVENFLATKRQFPRFSKFEKLLEKNKQQEKEIRQDAVKPLAPAMRMSQRLKMGRDRARL